MSRCNTIIAAALAAAALAAPTALAQPPDIHAGLSEPAPEGQSTQDLRMPDTRDAARAATPSDGNAARPETAGNPNISADVDHPAQASDDEKHATTDDKSPPPRAARWPRSATTSPSASTRRRTTTSPPPPTARWPRSATTSPTASRRRRPSRRGPWRPTPATGSPDYPF